jgi:protein phosphatase
MTEPAKITIPARSLVLLIGPAGAGKSTFARRHFRRTAVLSSDRFRAMLCDDEADQSASGDAFELLHQVAARRLARGKLTVVDATNVRWDRRKPLLQLARACGRAALAIVFDLPEQRCLDWNEARRRRIVPPEVVRRQHRQLRDSLRRLATEGYEQTYVLGSPGAIDEAMVEVAPARAAACPQPRNNPSAGAGKDRSGAAG